jgi:hemoglobin-like flavoprotein
MGEVMHSTITPQQRSLVRRTFTSIAPNHGAVARLFYDRLFEIAPELRPMFTHNMELQREKVMQMLATLVASMDDTPHFTNMAHELGKRHVGYGVRNEHYVLVGRALLWALEEACPQVMTPAASASWAAAYGMIADVAMDGPATSG